jgi:hypothetical protein
VERQVLRVAVAVESQDGDGKVVLVEEGRDLAVVAVAITPADVGVEEHVVSAGPVPCHAGEAESSPKDRELRTR